MPRHGVSLAIALLLLGGLLAAGMPAAGQSNYTDFCSEEIDRLIDLQSQELDRDRRQKIVWEIQRKLEADVARPMLSWRNEYFTQWPYVKNLVPHHSLYNYGRMQEVWLDR